MEDFLDNAYVGIHCVASDGTILWANKAELSMLGHTKETYCGHHVSEFHVDADAIKNILNKLGNKELMVTNKNLRLQIKDRVTAEEELVLALQQLSDFVRINTVGGMASGMAHELNQPLTAIVHYINGALERLKAV